MFNSLSGQVLSCAWILQIIIELLYHFQVTEIKPLELKVKFGSGFHGRVHVTEVNILFWSGMVVLAIDHCF